MAHSISLSKGQLFPLGGHLVSHNHLEKKTVLRLARDDSRSRPTAYPYRTQASEVEATLKVLVLTVTAYAPALKERPHVPRKDRGRRRESWSHTPTDSEGHQDERGKTFVSFQAS